MRFEDYFIADELKKAISKLGWTRPTDIQYKAIPSILNGSDVLAIAQTGTGKTAAFAIPILDVLHRRKIKKRHPGIKCLVLAPTRELALQLHGVIEQIGRHTRVKALCIYGGVEQDPQIAMLDKGVDILVTTPGRMFDLVSQGHCKLHRVEVLVLDEADHMLDLGFIKDIRDLMHHLPRKRQTLFFSATINPTIKKLAYSLVRKPIRIQISPKDPVAKNIDHSVIFMDMDDKRFYLERLVKDFPDTKILVFVRTIVRAERVQKAMARVAVEAMTMHREMEQDDRLAVLNDFRAGRTKMLIATDVTARGIDIDDVDLVVNYDLPDYTENYVHRVGRTGRGKRRGIAYSFCAPKERDLLTEIEGFLGSPIKEFALDPLTRTGIVELSDSAELTMDDIVSQVQQERPKRKKKKKK
jgi:ATP-dependent RNA helicase RhlE